jgi:inhibitor of KinA
MPRHATPRVRVPLGSVGIAGTQTGVYPAETPGGWRLIGRTPLRPFDVERSDPFLMKAGDSVQFYPISRAEYDAWA